MRRLARLGMIVAFSASAMAAATAQTATRTTLTAETREISGRTVATFSATVLDADGAPIKGVVTLSDKGKSISGSALDAEGKAEIKLDGLSAGDHAVTAVFSGDLEHAASVSESVVVHPEATAPTPDFGLGINPTSLTVKVGSAGSIAATISPLNGFTGFISLSCAGPAGATTLPTGVTCTFAPVNLQVTSGAVTAEMSIQTTTGHSLNVAPTPARAPQTPVVLAILLPGVVGLGYLGRKRKALGRVALLLLIGGVAMLGTTGCNPRYYYLNHGPTFGGTATGTYTIQVIAQTSNGVAASEHAVNLALTVD